jgi:hypothetical protein
MEEHDRSNRRKPVTMVYRYKENMKKNISTEQDRMVNRWNTKEMKNQRKTDGWNKTEYNLIFL